MKKICTKCGIEKEITDFSPTSSYKGKPCHRSECRKCNSEAAKADYHRNSEVRKAAAKNWKQRNPDKVRSIRHQYQYNLSPQEYSNLLEKQGGKCPICMDALVKPFVDHCHITGKVRGLLCVTCNSGLGKLGDTVEGLQRALSYLQENS